MSPIVSVIISTYNRSSLVSRAIESILTQTYQDFELIIVNNASIDNTEKVIQSFSDSRIRYVCHKENKGGPAARNTGIKLALGKYIAFLDDDDQWLPEKLEKQVQKINKASKKVGLIYVGTEIIDEQTKSIIRTHHPQYQGNVYQRLLIGTILGSVSSVLVKRECFEKVGLFDEELKSCQDWDMWLRISEVFEFNFVEDILVKIYMHDVQISNNLASMIPGRTRMVSKHREKFQKHADIFIIHLKRLGKLHCLNGTWEHAFQWFGKVIKIKPFEFFKIIGWCLFEFPRVKFFLKEKKFKKYRI